ncbi:MAG: hypothetical protein WBA72_04120 [Ornithinimicrobium sp.]
MPVSAHDRAVKGVTVVVQRTSADDAALWGLLDALVPQARWCAQVLCSGEIGGGGDHPLSSEYGVPVRPLPAGSGTVVDLAIGELNRPDGWLWLLSDASKPRADALPQLRAAVHGSSRVGIVGPKLLAIKDPRAVVGVGHRITVWGRSLDSMDVGAWDQGQFDDRRDVIGVPLDGMLIRGDVLSEVGGVEPAFDGSAAGLDVCWRAHLLGYRVLVAPRAVVAEHPPAAEGTAGDRDRALVALARASLWRLPGRSAAMFLSSVLSLLVFMVLRRPRSARRAWAELSAVAWPVRAYRARWRFRGSAAVSEGDLRGLFESESDRRAAARGAHDDGTYHAAAATPTEPQDRSIGAIEAGPVSEEAYSLADDERSQTRRWWSWPLAAAVLLVVAATAVRWRDLGAGLAPTGWGVTGSEAGAVEADAEQVYRAWALPFSGAGLGDPGQGPPWLLPFSVLGWVVEHLPAGPDGAHSAAFVTAWVLCASGVLSVLSAYLASRVVTRSRMVGAAVAIGWAAATPLSVAVGAGRVGPVVVHVLAPLMVAGAVRAVSRGSAGTSAALGVGLLTALATWFVPLTLVFALGAGVTVAIAAHGWARLRALPILLLPPALLGPQVLQFVQNPLLVWGGPGATDTATAPVTAWEVLLLHPGGPIPLSLWWIVPAWILAVLGAAWSRPGRRRGAALVLSVVALVAVAGAVVIGRLDLGVLPIGYPDAGLPVRVWSGSLLSLAGAALMLAAGAGATELLRRHQDPVSGGSPGAAAGSVLLTVAAVAALASVVSVAAVPLGTGLRVAEAPLPAVVAERATGAEGVRMLELRVEPASASSSQLSQGQRSASTGYEVSYDLVGREPGPWLRDRTRDLVRVEQRRDSDEGGGSVLRAEGDPVSAVVSELLDTASSTVSDQTPVEEALADLAVEFVVVDAPPGDPLLDQLDGLPSLTRVSSTQGLGLWRVVPEAVGSRVWAETTSGERQTLSLTGGRDTEAEVPADAQVVAISRPGDWAQVAQVRLDGQLLQAEPGFPVRYSLPPGGGALTIELERPYQRWWWVTAGLAVVSLFFALPTIGASRSRTR